MWSTLLLLLSYCAILCLCQTHHHHEWDIVTRNSNNFLYKGLMVSAVMMDDGKEWQRTEPFRRKRIFTFGVEIIIMLRYSS